MKHNHRFLLHTTIQTLAFLILNFFALTSNALHSRFSFPTQISGSIVIVDKAKYENPFRVSYPYSKESNDSEQLLTVMPHSRRTIPISDFSKHPWVTIKVPDPGPHDPFDLPLFVRHRGFSGKSSEPEEGRVSDFSGKNILKDSTLVISNLSGYEQEIEIGLFDEPHTQQAKPGEVKFLRLAGNQQIALPLK